MLYESQDGSWGASTMAKPSVLCSAGGKMVSAIDGRYLLNNGKQVIIALKTVAADLDMSTLESLEWVVDDLEETFKTGLHVDKVEYPLGDDRDGQVARGTIHKPSSVQVPRHRVPK